uniref:NADH dehydrogenase subunit 6 n=1 Tax=Tenguna kuankuoshuiensis TaxID=3054878 RepID=UPI0026E327BA|nr:NADH dehydrogenase subunit 6 [Tenguna kuankuoshuiensis]WJE88882.1 NADH dehydrogenase subunit 6 [Tenguna kuankuoshuiensis]
MMIPTIMANMTILPLMKHPIALGTMMIIQTTLMCVQQINQKYTPWYSYIMFITTIGGMMVMFIYMSSMASNEKLKKNMLIMSTWMITMMITLNLIKSNMIMNMIETKLIILNMEEIKTTTKMFNKPKLYLTIIIMMMLLITMISVTKIASTFEGPLKVTYV